jgi:hypothetical protein
MKLHTETFEIIKNGTPYSVQATRYLLNTETRFRVSVNKSPVHIFSWDDDLERLTATHSPDELPREVEIGIAEKLHNIMKNYQHAA